MAAKKATKKIVTPKNDQMFLEMLQEGITKGNWDMVCFAYKMKTGKELVPPKQPTYNFPAQSNLAPLAQAGQGPVARQPRENKFFDDGKTTRLGNKTLDSCQADLKIDKLLAPTPFENTYRDEYEEVEVQCELPNCGRKFRLGKDAYRENMAPSNFDGGEKVKLLICPKCSGEG